MEHDRYWSGIMVSIGGVGHSITAGEHHGGRFDMDHAWFTGMEAR